MRIILCGVNLLSFNRGVQALGFGAIDFLKEIFPSATIEVLSHAISKDSTSEINQFKVGRKDILKLLLPSFLTLSQSQRSIVQKLKTADYVFDLTEGDSFSDIYGERRFMTNLLFKKMVRRYAQKYILLQQTIGPFKSRVNLSLAASLMRTLDKVYVRDGDSYNLLKKLKIKTLLLPDVSLYMKQKKPTVYQIPFNSFVAINVSGLLYFDALKRGLVKQESYARIIEAITKLLLKKGESVLFVPHTYSVTNNSPEDDFMASLRVYHQFKGKYQNQIAIVDRELDAPEIKYILSRAKFTIASRMHACLGSLTTSRLSIALAYSYKFQGTFANFHAKEWVINLHQEESACEKTLSLVEKALLDYLQVSLALAKVVDELKSTSLMKIKKDLFHE